MFQPFRTHLSRAAIAVSALSLVASLNACDDPSTDPVDAIDDAFLTADGLSGKSDGGFDDTVTRAVLDLANRATHEQLDDEVRLDRRAADGIVDYRHGADGLKGTSDDRRFEDLETLDAVPYVGRVAFERMAEYALQHGYGAQDPCPGGQGHDVVDPVPPVVDGGVRGCDQKWFGDCHFGDSLPLPSQLEQVTATAIDLDGTVRVVGWDGSANYNMDELFVATQAAGTTGFTVEKLGHGWPNFKGFLRRPDGTHATLHTSRYVEGNTTYNHVVPYLDGQIICDGAYRGDAADHGFGTFGSDGTFWFATRTPSPEGAIEVCSQRAGESSWHRQLLLRGPALTGSAGYGSPGSVHGIVMRDGQPEVWARINNQPGGLVRYRLGGNAWHGKTFSGPLYQSLRFITAEDGAYMTSSEGTRMDLYQVTEQGLEGPTTLCTRSAYADQMCYLQGLSAIPGGGVLAVFEAQANGATRFSRYINGEVTTTDLANLPLAYTETSSAVSVGPFGGIYLLRSLLDRAHDVLRYLPLELAQ